MVLREPVFIPAHLAPGFLYNINCDAQTNVIRKLSLENLALRVFRDRVAIRVKNGLDTVGFAFGHAGRIVFGCRNECMAVS